MCGEVDRSLIGSTVAMNGWIQRSRNLGGLIFCDLRDKSGIVQIVFNQDVPEELFQRGDALRSEYVVGVIGRVKERESINPDLKNGDVEVIAEELVVYSEAETPPIYIKDDDEVSENLRMKYRYLDLRKHKMQANLTFRHKVAKLTRDFFDGEGFTEVETPMLIKPTPEGARDYLVPSRVNQGSFYALPQSPQMFKQILMAGGTDRYMQIVKCFRDEDLRADRQPEFTQIDLEMSFVDVDDVLEVQERYLQRLFREIMNVEVNLPLPRIPYEEAMERYGSDKPDTRFGFELKSLSELVADSAFPLFADAVSDGGTVRGINLNGYSDRFSRKDIDKLQDDIKTFGAKGLFWIRVSDAEITSSFNKFYDPEGLKNLASVFDATSNDLILIVAGPEKVVFDSLGFLRRELAGRLGLLDEKRFDLLWVVDFPLLEYNEEAGRFTAMHHPFTSPHLDDIPLLATDPGKVRAKAYDIVLNGVEIGGGSIRIHDRELQKTMFRALGLSDEEAANKFGFLLEAFRYGVPPHGGLAYGLDRMIMLLRGEKSIREVIAFPKNQAAACLLSEAPSPAGDDQLKELGIELVKE
ncbi:MAG: aspartate--tRNA ligase [Firmicutes bacterium HGW-Firmicutes-11]|jgi:aspartyl-tRNA synthetase|nr:MAG: aspartate--tRNA ligase [Firmicutes bacterium HGW-Firmicutes-11]